MAWIGKTSVNADGVLRTVAATFGALLKTLFNVATQRGAGPRVELKPGDMAPDFVLPGSDGRTYRLSELLGDGPIAIAWFPKAFTGG
jgi:peroxiredoxin Q/BCP